ncbi:MAG TPA: histidine kinase, partial [Gammaproteobacteria bacterium]|nr:histidine kinase [Gammaproteobacteria bacterium]
IDEGALRVEVKNTGRWIAPARVSGDGGGTDTGLNNVRERLLAHYPGRHAFDLYENDGWVHARIRIDDAR